MSEPVKETNKILNREQMSPEVLRIKLYILLFFLLFLLLYTLEMLFLHI